MFGLNKAKNRDEALKIFDGHSAFTWKQINEVCVKNYDSIEVGIKFLIGNNVLEEYEEDKETRIRKTDKGFALRADLKSDGYLITRFRQIGKSIISAIGFLLTIAIFYFSWTAYQNERKYKEESPILLQPKNIRKDTPNTQSDSTDASPFDESKIETQILNKSPDSLTSK